MIHLGARAGAILDAARWRKYSFNPRRGATALARGARNGAR